MSDEGINEVQEAQAALRESIEHAKELTAKSDRLLHQHRGEPAKTQPRLGELIGPAF